MTSYLLYSHEFQKMHTTLYALECFLIIGIAKYGRDLKILKGLSINK